MYSLPNKNTEFKEIMSIYEQQHPTCQGFKILTGWNPLVSRIPPWSNKKTIHMPTIQYICNGESSLGHFLQTIQATMMLKLLSTVLSRRFSVWFNYFLPGLPQFTPTESEKPLTLYPLDCFLLAYLSMHLFPCPAQAWFPCAPVLSSW